MSGGGWGTRSAAPTLSSQRVAGGISESVREPGAIRFNDLPQTYPRVAFAPDPRDTDMALKEELLGQNKVSGVVQLGQADIDYRKSKMDQMEELAKDIWISTLFDETDPATKKYVSELLPDHHDREQRYYNNAMDAAKRYTKINMHGIQDKSDIDWLWAVRKGDIHIPSSYLPAGLSVPLADTGPPGESFDHTAPGRGLFNPKRFFARIPDAAPTPGYSTTNQINPWATPDFVQNAPAATRLAYNAPMHQAQQVAVGPGYDNFIARALAPLPFTQDIAPGYRYAAVNLHYRDNIQPPPPPR